LSDRIRQRLHLEAAAAAGRASVPDLFQQQNYAPIRRLDFQKRRARICQEILSFQSECVPQGDRLMELVKNGLALQALFFILLSLSVKGFRDQMSNEALKMHARTGCRSLIT